MVRQRVPEGASLSALATTTKKGGREGSGTLSKVVTLLGVDSLFSLEGYGLYTGLEQVV